MFPRSGLLREVRSYPGACSDTQVVAPMKAPKGTYCRNGDPGSPVSRRTSAQLVKEVLEQDDGVVLSWRFTCRDGERDGEPLAVRGHVEAS
jgi:hypothetical protein